MTDVLKKYKAVMSSNEGQCLLASAKDYIKLRKQGSLIIMDWTIPGRDIQHYELRTVEDLIDFMCDLGNIVNENIALLDQPMQHDQEKADVMLVTQVMTGVTSIVIDFLFTHYPEYTWNKQLLKDVYCTTQ